MGSILTLRHSLGSGGALETRWASLLSHPDSCPTDGVHLTPSGQSQSRDRRYSIRRASEDVAQKLVQDAYSKSKHTLISLRKLLHHLFQLRPLHRAFPI